MSIFDDLKDLAIEVGAEAAQNAANQVKEAAIETFQDFAEGASNALYAAGKAVEEQMSDLSESILNTFED